MLSIASRAPPPPVNTSILKVPNTEAKPSSTNCPGGILALKVDVETGLPFSSACTVIVLLPPHRREIERHTAQIGRETNPQWPGLITIRRIIAELLNRCVPHQGHKNFTGVTHRSLATEVCGQAIHGVAEWEGSSRCNILKVEQGCSRSRW